MNSKKELIFLLIILSFILLIDKVLSQEINFSYPQNITVGQEFNVILLLTNFSQDIYDVKFDIKNGSSYISKTFWDNEWLKNRWLNNAINLSEKNNETFRLNITENYYGINNITVKIRNSSNNIDEFTYLINISNNNLSNTSNNFNNSSNNSQNINVYYNLSWDEDNIINGEDFKIKIDFFNLLDIDYDVRLWIENNGEIISERYDEKNEKWKSGFYYINGFIKGQGNKTEEIKIRINNDYSNFSGEAEIFFKIRDEPVINYKINISEKDKNVQETIIDNVSNNSNNTESIENTQSITSNVIRLGKSIEINKKENIKTQSFIIYESKTGIIKKYSVYGFAVLCILLSILIIWNKM